MKVLYQASPMDIREEEIVLRSLEHVASAAKSVPAVPAKSVSYHCPYANEQQNSRSGPLPLGKMEVAWKAELLSGSTPRFVLNDAGYTVVQSVAWQIFDGNGTPVGEGRTGPGQIFVDAAAGLIYSIDMNGYLAANQLIDGQRKFITSTWGGDLAAFGLVQKRGQELLLAGFELPKNDFERPVDAAHQPESSILNLIRLSDSLKINSGGFLTGTSSKTLHIMAAPLQAARNNDTLVVTVPGGIFFIDNELKVKAAYALDAKPLALSLDEVGRAYLIVKNGERSELWMVTPQGELGFSGILPPSSDLFPKPPVVGYDHRVFVTIDNELLVFWVDGRSLGSRSLSGKPGGMVVTPTGDLLVSDGSELVVFTKDGNRKILYEFPGSKLITPPVITDKGEILVATETNLFCLHAN